MAIRTPKSDSDGFTAEASNTIFIDTSLDTHLAMIVSDTDTVADLKKNIMSEHPRCFPRIGEIKILALKVNRKGYFYHLSDSMFVKSAFEGKRNWFLSVDASCPKVQNENLLCCGPDTSNQLALHDQTNYPSGDRNSLLNYVKHDLLDEKNKVPEKQNNHGDAITRGRTDDVQCNNSVEGIFKNGLPVKRKLKETEDFETHAEHNTSKSKNKKAYVQLNNSLQEDSQGEPPARKKQKIDKNGGDVSLTKNTDLHSHSGIETSKSETAIHKNHVEEKGDIASTNSDSTLTKPLEDVQLVHSPIGGKKKKKKEPSIPHDRIVSDVPPSHHNNGGEESLNEDGKVHLISGDRHSEPVQEAVEVNNSDSIIKKKKKKPSIPRDQIVSDMPPSPDGIIEKKKKKPSTDHDQIVSDMPPSHHNNGGEESLNEDGKVHLISGDKHSEPVQEAVEVNNSDGKIKKKKKKPSIPHDQIVSDMSPSHHNNGEESLKEEGKIHLISGDKHSEPIQEAMEVNNSDDVITKPLEDVQLIHSPIGEKKKKKKKKKHSIHNDQIVSDMLPTYHNSGGEESLKDDGTVHLISGDKQSEPVQEAAEVNKAHGSSIASIPVREPNDSTIQVETDAPVLADGNEVKVRKSSKKRGAKPEDMVASDPNIDTTQQTNKIEEETALSQNHKPEETLSGKTKQLNTEQDTDSSSRTIKMSQAPSSRTLESEFKESPHKATVDGNALENRSTNDANISTEDSRFEDGRINFKDYFVPASDSREVIPTVPVDKVKETKRSDGEPEAKKKTKMSKPPIGTSENRPESDGNQGNVNKSDDVNSDTIHLRESLPNDEQSEEAMLRSNKKSSKVSETGSRPTSNQNIDQLYGSGIKSSSTKNLKENGLAKATLSSESSHRIVQDKTENKHQSHNITVMKASTKKSLLSTPGAIFSYSSDDENDAANCDASTRAPSQNSSSGNSGKEGSYSSKRKAADLKNIERPAWTRPKDITMEEILKSSSRYKKAKLTASQSQPEDSESQTVK